MKFTLDWLSEFVDLPTNDPEEITAAFESLGHEVEGWERVETRFTDVVIGKVLEVGAHPNADKVRVTKVDVGDEVLDIICGAWNFDAGAIVPVAKPGAVLQGDFKITQRKIRGVTSNGMICSESELEVGEDADGIMVLDTDYPDAAQRLGEDFRQLLPDDDIVFDVTITPNRPDCMSVYGLARELAAYLRGPNRRTASGLPDWRSCNLGDDSRRHRPARDSWDERSAGSPSDHLPTVSGHGSPLPVFGRSATWSTQATTP